MSTFLWSTPRIVLTRHERPTASKTSDLRKALSLVNKKKKLNSNIKRLEVLLMGRIFLELISLNAKFSGRFCEIMANLHTGGSWITKVKERLAFIILGEKKWRQVEEQTDKISRQQPFISSTWSQHLFALVSDPWLIMFSFHERNLFIWEDHRRYVW